MILACVLTGSVALAVAPCSTGAQLYSNWQTWAAEVDSLEESVTYHFEQFEKAAERQVEAQYAVSFHTGWHACNPPCEIMMELLDNLADRRDATDCARDAWIEASDTLDQAEIDRDNAQMWWLTHLNEPCEDCQEWSED